MVSGAVELDLGEDPVSRVEGATQWFSRRSYRKWLKPSPASGLDWLFGSKFARQRPIIALFS